MNYSQYLELIEHIQDLKNGAIRDKSDANTDIAKSYFEGYYNALKYLEDTMYEILYQ